ncbi:FtsL-like putative cell division protein [Maribacter chungangensis]|uniref:FtsL-like putative cell division protein n=1 Tax=Maribacter chungangensis TaxID=1069117 RepID=A0ABW3B953_9FLAO
MKVKKGILDILKGKFLISGDAPKNWLFIIFASFLAAVMISSSHSADKKVHRIAALNEEVRELRSEFVDARSDVQQLKLESTITKTVADKGLFPSETPPQKIKVTSQKPIE